MSSKIIGKERSKIANDKKKEYIKRGRKSNVIHKLNTRATESKLQNIKKPAINDDDECTENDEISTDGSEKYIIKFDSVTDDINKKLRRHPPNKKQSRNNIDDIKALELQKEIEQLKLNQIKQNKKVSRIQNKIPDNHIPNQDTKPINHKANALKTKLLVEF